jgi:hypothetical protein
MKRDEFGGIIVEEDDLRDEFGGVIDAEEKGNWDRIWGGVTDRTKERYKRIVAPTVLGNIAKKLPVVGPVADFVASGPERTARTAAGVVGEVFEPLNVLVGEGMRAGAGGAAAGVDALEKNKKKGGDFDIGAGVFGRIGEVGKELGGIVGDAATKHGPVVKEKWDALPESVKADLEIIPDAANVLGWGAGKAAGKAALETMGKESLGTLEKKAASAVEKGFSKGVKPLDYGKKGYSAFNDVYEKGADAVKAIAEHRGSVQLVDEAGETIARPRTVLEFAQAIEKTKQSIYNQYHQMAVEAGDAGAKFDAMPIVNKIKTVAAEKGAVLKPGDSRIAKSEEIRAYAHSRIADIAELQGASPEIVEARIKELNNSLQPFYLNNTGKAKAEVDASIAQALRGQLDSQIEGAVGPGYQRLKNQYSALKRIERDVNHRAKVLARRPEKGFFDLTDIFSNGELALGVATLNPALLAKAGAQKATLGWTKWLTNPDRYIDIMFDRAYKLADAPKPGLGKIMDFDAMKVALPENAESPAFARLRTPVNPDLAIDNEVTARMRESARNAGRLGNIALDKRATDEAATTAAAQRGLEQRDAYQWNMEQDRMKAAEAQMPADALEAKRARDAAAAQAEAAGLAEQSAKERAAADAAIRAARGTGSRAMMPPQVVGGVAGGTIGAALPAETPEERTRNIVIGTGLGFGGGMAAHTITVAAEKQMSNARRLIVEASMMANKNPQITQAQAEMSLHKLSPTAQTVIADIGELQALNKTMSKYMVAGEGIGDRRSVHAINKVMEAHPEMRDRLLQIQKANPHVDFVDDKGYLRAMAIEMAQKPDAHGILEDSLMPMVEEEAAKLGITGTAKEKIWAVAKSQKKVEDTGFPTGSFWAQNVGQIRKELADMGLPSSGKPMDVAARLAEVKQLFVPKYQGFSRSLPQMYWDGLGNSLREEVRTQIYKDTKDKAARGILPKGFFKTTIKGMEAQSKDFGIMSPLRTADKTGAAFNSATACPMFTIGNNGCWDACYTTQMGAGGTCYSLYRNAPYTGEILRMTKKEINWLNNKYGGLRVNGGGGYNPENAAQLLDLLSDAKDRGLAIKVITKQEGALKMLDDAIAQGLPVPADLQVQPSFDYMWVPVKTDLARAGNGAAAFRMDEMIAAGHLEGAAITYREMFGREAKVVNGELYRKYGFSVDQVKDMQRKYPNLTVLPRVVAGTPEEAIQATKDFPQTIITLMHGKIPDYAHSDVGGSLQNWTGNHKFEMLPNGEARISKVVGKKVVGSAAHKALQDAVNNVPVEQRPALLKALKEQTCCQAGAHKHACFNCSTGCNGIQKMDYTTEFLTKEALRMSAEANPNRLAGEIGAAAAHSAPAVTPEEIAKQFNLEFTGMTDYAEMAGGGEYAGLPKMFDFHDPVTKGEYHVKESDLANMAEKVKQKRNDFLGGMR